MAGKTTGTSDDPSEHCRADQETSLATSVWRRAETGGKAGTEVDGRAAGCTVPWSDMLEEAKPENDSAGCAGFPSSD